MTHQTDVTECGDVSNYLSPSKKRALLNEGERTETKIDGANFPHNYLSNSTNLTDMLPQQQQTESSTDQTRSYTDISSTNKEIKIVRYRLEKEKTS